MKYFLTTHRIVLVRLLKGIDMQEKRHMGDETHEGREEQGKGCAGESCKVRDM